MMRVLYLSLSLVPAASVIALAYCVLRAVSVRVVWREPGASEIGSRLDDEPA